MKKIGKITATEKIPTTIEEFIFWTDRRRILNPFDIVKVSHINDSATYGQIEEISHITDSDSFINSYVSNDFGDIEHQGNTQRLGMNFVKARVILNDKNIYTPVLHDSDVSLADQAEVTMALGLDKIENPIPCGYLRMYEGENDQEIRIPVNFNSNFLIGPEGAHLNITGISGLAAKTSYAMFLMKALQNKKLASNDPEETSTAFIIFNVKGRDLLAIDQENKDLSEEDKSIYKELELPSKPFTNCKYFYPYHRDNKNTYAKDKDIDLQIDGNKAFKYKYLYEYDKEYISLFFNHIDDPNETMDSIINMILNEEGDFNSISSWSNLKDKVQEYSQAGKSNDKTIPVVSWRKFKRIIDKALSNKIFANNTDGAKNEVRLADQIEKIQKNDAYVIDIAKLDENMQSFVFGSVLEAVYDLKLGESVERETSTIPSKVIIFIDELNKYASNDVPKNSPILRKLIDITERGRSLGIILFGAQQFKSVINPRVKGNCATLAYGRTNAIEISTGDYRFIPNVYKSMMTRLNQGEYIVQNPMFRSLLSIKFPKPVYKQFKNG